MWLGGDHRVSDFPLPFNIVLLEVTFRNRGILVSHLRFESRISAYEFAESTRFPIGCLVVVQER